MEHYFVNRLLQELGYEDHQIRPKTSLQELHVNLGHRRLLYKPDYAISVGRTIRWIIEAKAVGEPLDDFVGQCSGYCLALNRAYPASNPVTYFLLTDGLNTRLYEWDREQPLLVLHFDDFTKTNVKFRRLRNYLSPQALSRQTEDHTPDEFLTLTREPIDEVNSAFAWCHQFIYRKDNLSQAAAFSEFVKIVFLKLISDREVHRTHPEFARTDTVDVPLADVRFSVKWIEERERDHPNPLDALQFQRLLQELEGEIQGGTRKRVFDADEHIDLAPETIKGVVRRLQHVDLFGIDADLNGRLFETFLNATMRGKDLGQYFTPRSVVKLGVRLARLRVGRDGTDTVIDACCGTGGFLIDVLADMWTKVDANASLSNDEREQTKQRITSRAVVGIDVARDPPLARIARMNMYLHGDGGSSIYQADALDKQLRDRPTASAELQRETHELRDRLAREQFDVVLTNPPFAKEYERTEEGEAEVLDEYEVGFATDARGARRPRRRLRSSVMFIERYHDLLKPGGRMVTVLDDGVLGGAAYAWFRAWLRERYLLRVVVSLPGDAFQRSRARVKTSLVVLEKRRTSTEEQPPVFMYYTTSVGVDDSPRQRTLPVDRLNRERARQEIADVTAMYEAFLNGEPAAQAWTVTPDRLCDRIDVKSCLPEPGRKIGIWNGMGLTVTQLDDMVDVLYPTPGVEAVFNEPPTEPSDVIVTADSDEVVTQLRAKYDGFAEAGDEIVASDSSYGVLYRVHAEDIVISHINAIHGAICVVPAILDGSVVTSEYTVCRAKDGIDPRLVWLLLRSPEVRSDLLLLSTGIGRSRVRWDAASQVALPRPPDDLAEAITADVRDAETKEAEARALRQNAHARLISELLLDSAAADRILAAFKPPR